MTERAYRVVDHIARVLGEHGVRHVFGVHGANIEDLYDALLRGGSVQAVVAKHEFSAATMADGGCRTSGALGVVASTSGAGAMNIVPGVAEAHASRIPMLALVGQPPQQLEGRGAFQDSSGLAGAFDAQRLFATISRFCERVIDPARIDEQLRAALGAARSSPQGPAVLLLPKDVQQALVASDLERGSPFAPTGLGPPAAPALELSADVRSALRRAAAAPDGVLVIAGLGVALANARDELRRLAGGLGAWVAVAPDAKDAFDNRARRFAGVAGPLGHPNVRGCLARAEVCIVAGTRLPQLVGGGLADELAGCTVLCIDPEPPFVDAGSCGELLWVGGELRRSLRAALATLAADGRTGARECPPHDGPLPRALPVPSHDGLTYRELVHAIAAALPDETTVVSDAGNASAHVLHSIPTPRDGHFVVALGMGGMGHSFGAGIGAAFATRRRAFVLSGDGGFYMHGMEVHTAIEHDLPVTFVVFNNNAHAMCVTREQLFFGDPPSFNLFRGSDIGGGLARMFPSLRVAHPETAEELRHFLVATNATDGPALAAVDVDPHELPPFAPFLPQPEALICTDQGASAR